MNPCKKRKRKVRFGLVGARRLGVYGMMMSVIHIIMGVFIASRVAQGYMEMLSYDALNAKHHF